MFYIYNLFLGLGMGMLLPFIAAYFVSNTILQQNQVTMMLSLAPLITVLAQNLFGYLSDKTSKHKLVLMFVLVMTSMASLVLMLTSTFKEAILVILVHLVFVFFNSNPSMLSDNFTLTYAKRNNRQFGRIRLFASLGFAIAGQIAGILTDHFGVRILFFLFASFMLLVTFIVPFFPKMEEEKEVQENNEEAPLKENLYSQLLHNKDFVKVVILAFFILSGIGANGTFFGIYVTSYAGLSLSFLGTATLISAGTEIPMMFVADRLIKQFGAYKLLVLAAFLNASRFMVYLLLPYKIPILLVTATQGIGFGIAYTATMYLIYDKVSLKTRATGISMMNSIAFSLGNTMLSLIGSLLLNPRTVYILLFVVEVIGVCFGVYLLKKEKHKKTISA
jgi:Major Facilitator Superfamily.